MTHEEKLRLGIELLQQLRTNLLELEVQFQMELAGCPADSGFTEAVDEVNKNWKKFTELFPE